MLTGAVAGLLIKEFCRREEPTIFDVRVGFVRVCLDEVRKFEVAKVVAVEVAMTLKGFWLQGGRWQEGNCRNRQNLLIGSSRARKGRDPRSERPETVDDMS